jgi:hypothetical protein
VERAKIQTKMNITFPMPKVLCAGSLRKVKENYFSLDKEGKKVEEFKPHKKQRYYFICYKFA